MTAPAVTAPGDLRRVWTLPGVYVPQADSRLLARAMSDEGIRPGSDVLDLCTGSGALALHAAGFGARVTAVDVGRRAVLTARVNAVLAGRRIRVHRGDLTRPLAGRSFDLVVSNPPYVPAPVAPVRGRARAWDAGRHGRACLDRICDAADGLLRSGGVLLLVHSAVCDPSATLGRLRGAGLRAAVHARGRTAYGPVMRARSGWLAAQGLTAPHADEEELVVIRAVRT